MDQTNFSWQAFGGGGGDGDGCVGGGVGDGAGDGAGGGGGGPPHTNPAHIDPALTAGKARAIWHGTASRG